jgi:hypothetical protein
VVIFSQASWFWFLNLAGTPPQRPLFNGDMPWVGIHPKMPVDPDISLIFIGPVTMNIYLVGGLEPWNFMTFHNYIGNFIIPTFTHIFQRRSTSTTNQL